MGTSENMSWYGGGGIRTHGALADTLVFKTRALNHSTTPPSKNIKFLAFLLYQKMLKIFGTNQEQ